MRILATSVALASYQNWPSFSRQSSISMSGVEITDRHANREVGTIDSPRGMLHIGSHSIATIVALCRLGIYIWRPIHQVSEYIYQKLGMRRNGMAAWSGLRKTQGHLAFSQALDSPAMIILSKYLHFTLSSRQMFLMPRTMKVLRP